MKPLHGAALAHGNRGLDPGVSGAGPPDVKEQTKAFVYRTESRADELPLDMIEGISLFHKSQLNEVGIDNAQNLAQANLVKLARGAASLA